MVEESKKKVVKKDATKATPAAKPKVAAAKTTPKKSPEKKAPVVKKTTVKKVKPVSADVVEVERGHRKTRTGVVLSDKMDSTIVVGVQSLFKHPLYHKTMKRTTKFVAHDPEARAGIGDTVLIMESRPLSKTKRWRLVNIVSKAR